MRGRPPIGPIFGFAPSLRPLAPPSERLKIAIFGTFRRKIFAKFVNKLHFGLELVLNDALGSKKA